LPLEMGILIRYKTLAANLDMKTVTTRDEKLC
jgi:hypothetical protein